MERTVFLNFGDHTAYLFFDNLYSDKLRTRIRKIQHLTSQHFKKLQDIIVYFIKQGHFNLIRTGFKMVPKE